MDGRGRGEIRRGCRQARTIGLAIMGASGLMAVLMELLRIASPSYRGIPGFEQLEILRYVLMAVAAGEVLLIRHFARMPFPVMEPRPGIQSPLGDHPPAILQLIIRHVILGALSFSVAVYGVMLFLIGLNPADLYGFLGLSLVLQWLHLPRVERWEESLREAAHPASRGPRLPSAGA